MDTKYPVVLEVEYDVGYSNRTICVDPEDLYLTLNEAEEDKHFKSAKLYRLVEIKFPNLGMYAEIHKSDYSERDEVFPVGDWMEDH